VVINGICFGDAQEAVLQLLKEAIQNSADTSEGFLIDGYPRELEQGKRFEAEIGPVELVIYLQVSNSEINLSWYSFGGRSQYTPV
jgi:adenylate kinase family enzyme